jgi:hypothetical protein
MNPLKKMGSRMGMRSYARYTHPWPSLGLPCMPICNLIRQFLLYLVPVWVLSSCNMRWDWLQGQGLMKTHDEDTRKFFRHSSVICVMAPRYASSKLGYIKQKVNLFYT